MKVRIGYSKRMVEVDENFDVVGYVVHVANSGFLTTSKTWPYSRDAAKARIFPTHTSADNAGVRYTTGLFSVESAARELRVQFDAFGNVDRVVDMVRLKSRPVVRAEEIKYTKELIRTAEKNIKKWKKEIALIRKAAKK